jgi:hypothetical protein
MRFSSIFQPRDPDPRKASDEEVARVDAAPPVVTQTVQELPDDLDARVRLIGEWQLGEG